MSEIIEKKMKKRIHSCGSKMKKIRMKITRQVDNRIEVSFEHIGWYCRVCKKFVHKEEL